jgi:hypothetical protein
MTLNFRAFLFVVLVVVCCFKAFASPPAVLTGLYYKTAGAPVAASAVATQPKASSSPVNADPGFSGPATALILSAVGCAFILAIVLCLRK